MNDFEISNIVKGLRGKRSPKEMSQILGYSYNKYIKLEGAYQQLTWNQFVDLSNVSDVDLRSILFRYFHIRVEDLSQESVVNALVDYWSFESEALLLEHLNISRSKWWRIKSGKSKMTVSEFVSLLDFLVGKRGKDLFKEYPNLNKEDVIEYTNELLLSIIKVYPEFASFIAAGRTTTYQQSEDSKFRKNILANSAGISIDRLEIIQKGILKFGIDIFDPSSFKPYKICISSVDLEAHYELVRHSLRYHTQEHHSANIDHSRIKTTAMSAAVSKSDITKIADVLHRAMVEIGQIMLEQGDEPKSEVANVYLGEVASCFEPKIPEIKH